MGTNMGDNNNSEEVTNPAYVSAPAEFLICERVQMNEELVSILSKYGTVGVATSDVSDLFEDGELARMIILDAQTMSDWIGAQEDPREPAPMTKSLVTVLRSDIDDTHFAIRCFEFGVDAIIDWPQSLKTLDAIIRSLLRR